MLSTLGRRACAGLLRATKPTFNTSEVSRLSGVLLGNSECKILCNYILLHTTNYINYKLYVLCNCEIAMLIVIWSFCIRYLIYELARSKIISLVTYNVSTTIIWKFSWGCGWERERSHEWKMKVFYNLSLLNLLVFYYAYSICKIKTALVRHTKFTYTIQTPFVILICEAYLML